MIRYKHPINYSDMDNKTSFKSNKESLMSLQYIINVFQHEFSLGKGCEKLCLGEGYIDGKIVSSSKSSNNKNINDYFYVLLRDQENRADLKELISNRVVFNFENYDNIIFCTPLLKLDITENETISTWDSLIFYCDLSNKWCYVYSVLNGFSFSPYHFDDIIVYDNGIIVDGKFAIDKQGTTINLATYTKVGKIYYDSTKDDYLFFIDSGNMLFTHMFVEDKEWLSFEDEDIEYRINKVTKEISTKIIGPLCKPNESAWSYEELKEAYDSAYEGYSTLELGYE